MNSSEVMTRSYRDSFFFFQAEDGIRDADVTGVQTCALPILELREAILSAVAVSGIVIWMWNVAEGGLPSLGSTTLRVGLFTGSSLVTALIFGIMAQESRLLKEHGRKNRELNDRLAESVEQLRC